MDQKVVFHPIIISIQKIALYETKSRFYLIGSNISQSRFRVLKIDRLDAKELNIYDDKVEYSQDEIHDLVNMIDNGNRHRSSSFGIAKVISAFGIVGFIRFLEGYYIILVTKRRKVAVIGNHTIYKIEDTSMIYIPHDSIRLLHPDEQRYVKMFQSIDLSSNFYFSYSYDITHTLQNNMCPPKYIIPHILTGNSGAETEISSPVKCFTSTIFSGNGSNQKTNNTNNCQNVIEDYGIRTKPHRKFVWNTHLLSDVEKELHPDWILYITHGFVGQSNMSVFGKSVYVTLVARRSRKFAGTRFLKRGANIDGDVANEVETEQIMHDSDVSSLSQGRFSSFVQMRGSIPVHWSQDISKMVPKPAISIDLNDPFAETAAMHFGELFKRYGAPIVLLNLVKKREKKKHESFLTDELRVAVKYLNQFLPQEHQIMCVCFDMARKNKKKTVNVMLKLEEIAKKSVMKTGFFLNQNRYYAQKAETVVGQDQHNGEAKGSLQMGIIRTNCVDCLDRTNTAQFVIGKLVLGYQLCALGMLDSPKLEFDTDCVRMLESLYEDHGDTLALQYGGSQLVHRIKTYRKTAPWTSQGNDIMQTLSRYYSNTFSDAEKQNTINLFLGLFVPDEHKPQIWELFTDYYFHNKVVIREPEKPLTQWWDRNVVKCLPLAYIDVTKSCYEMIKVQSRDVDMIDAYSDYHRPFELTVLTEMFAYQISNSIRDFMPNFTTNFSPFSVRVRPGRRREDSKANSMKNPSLTGQSSTSSTASSSGSENDIESSDDDISINPQDSTMTGSREMVSVSESATFETLFPTMKQVYGTELALPKRPDVLRYRKYVQIGRKANGTLKPSALTKPLKLEKQSSFASDTTEAVAPPAVNKASRSIYSKYIKTGKIGGFEPEAKAINMYMNYVLNAGNLFPKYSKTAIQKTLWD